MWRIGNGHKTFMIMIRDTSYKPCALCTDITLSQYRVATRTRAPLPFVCRLAREDRLLRQGAKEPGANRLGGAKRQRGE